MKKKIKKAFTLVELLVVIAILAILATVSIVGYNSFTKKAKVSNDTVLVKQMNDVLFANQQTDDKNNTMTEALEDVFGAGYDVEKLTPTTTNYNIVWDSENDQMVLLDDNKNVVYPTEKVTTKDKMFLITKTSKDFTDTKDEFAHYLTSEFTYDDRTLAITTGLDAGSNANVNAISYTGTDTAKTISIRTNGGKLVVNGPKDTVNHYGAADYTNVVAVYDESFHEFGVSAYARIASGHFVAESTAKVLNLNVASSDVKITENTGAKVNSYSKDSDTVVVKVNGTVKDNVETKDENSFENESKDSSIVADGGVAEADGVIYSTLESAANVAKSNSTIKLLKDYSYSNEIQFTKNITIDFNGHTLETRTNTNGAPLSITNGMTLSIKDTSATKGKLTANYYGISAENGTIIFEDITIESALACLTGNNKAGNMHIVIKSGTLTSRMSETIYMPSQGTIEIYDGVLNGGISMRMGMLTMSGGTINGLSSKQSADLIGNYWDHRGSVWIGDAIFVMAGTYSTKYAENNNCTINITGGTINGNAHNAICVYDIGTDYDQLVKVNVSSATNVSGNVLIERNITSNTKYNRTYHVDATINYNGEELK